MAAPQVVLSFVLDAENKVAIRVAKTAAAPTSMKIEFGDYSNTGNGDAIIPVPTTDDVEKFVTGIADLCTARYHHQQLPPQLLKVAATAAKRLQQHPPRSHDDESVQIPDLPLLKAKLFVHQRVALRFVLDTPRSLLCMCLGSGKTLTAIAAIVALEAKALVVCPASLRSNWLSEFQKFAPHLNVMIAKNAKKISTVLSADVVVVSYSLLSGDGVLKQLKTNRLDIMINDEAHYAKHKTSQRAKAVYKLSKVINRVVLLSGTPAQKHSELWHLLRIIDNVSFKLFHHQRVPYTRGAVPSLPCASTDQFYFGERYCVPELVRVSGGRFAYVFKQNTRHEELRAITRHLILRMSKEAVLSHLPSHTRETIVLGTLSKRQQKHYEDEKNRASTLRDTKGSIYGDAVLMELVRNTTRMKLPMIKSYVKMLLESTDEKFIVFAHHRIVAETLAEMIGDTSMFISVNGETPMKSRDALFKRFETDDKCRVGLLSLGACSTGLNLTFVRLVVFAELVFLSTLYVQAEGRAHRTGQKRAVISQYLMMNGSTDDLVFASLRAKVMTQARLLDCGDDTSGLSAAVVVEDEQKEDKERPRKRRKRATVVEEIPSSSDYDD
jgi:SWI/SNF-related matrix-associated actin-dependent regulator 1 of chromatin subfamily A